MSYSHNEFNENLNNNATRQKPILVHVGQIHECGTPSKTDEAIAYSQFNVAKTIIANPEAIVLLEGLTKDITRQDCITPELVDFTPMDKTKEESIKNAFPKGFPDRFDELTIDQKKWIASDTGAAYVLLALGVINFIYKTDTDEEYDKLSLYLNNKGNFYLNLSTKLRLFYNPFIFLPELKHMVLDRREESALRFSDEAIKKSGKNNPVVLLIYGARHNFEKKFEQLKNSFDMVYAGFVITCTVDYNLYSYKEKILPCGVPIEFSQFSTIWDKTIPLETFREILKSYCTIYPSTSIFASGYNSKAMRSLVKFLNNAEKEKIENVRYLDIIELLTKADESKARLLRVGKLPEKIITATDKVIMDLHKAFDKIQSSNTENNNNNNSL